MADEVVGSQHDAARLIEEDGVGGAVTGPVQDRKRALCECELRTVG